ncbi:sensory rhodopsin transducer [Palleronia sp.]|uniref:sensory rhodopsin transducer n=1 Tax=Palleronia sp. TaxID=1940284 RepID=UPI0035C81EE1
MESIGSTRWVVAEGYIPSPGIKEDRALESHETFCILNTGPDDAQISITLFFADRAPVGPCGVVVPAERTMHLRAYDLDDPEPVPRDTDYATVIEPNVPVVVQHSPLDSRPEAFALLSTVAFPAL